jgi:hypothetical protein
MPRFLHYNKTLTAENAGNAERESGFPKNGFSVFLSVLCVLRG